MKLFSVWDSVTEILDTFYGMGIDKNMRFKFRVMDKLKEINPALWGLLKNDVLLIIEAQLITHTTSKFMQA